MCMHVCTVQYTLYSTKNTSYTMVINEIFYKFVRDKSERVRLLTAKN